MALLHGLERGLERGSPGRLCCGADTVQHAEGGEALEQKGALDLRERPLLLERVVEHRVVVVEGGAVGVELSCQRRDLPGA